jgi:hypothetical protein
MSADSSARRCRDVPMIGAAVARRALRGGCYGACRCRGVRRKRAARTGGPWQTNPAKQTKATRLRLGAAAPIGKQDP